MVTYTRSSQQAQWTFQKAALTGLIGYKKREGGHRQEKGACLRCPEDWEEVRGRYDQDKSFICITSSENIWKYFIRNARCIIVLVFFFLWMSWCWEYYHESHFFLKVSVDILSHIFTELAVFQIIDLPVLMSTSCFHCVFLHLPFDFAHSFTQYLKPVSTSFSGNMWLWWLLGSLSFIFYFRGFFATL